MCKDLCNHQMSAAFDFMLMFCLNMQIMQSQFAQDNNPDAQTLQKLADMTGLSRRVIQVGTQMSTFFSHSFIYSCHGRVVALCIEIA